MLQYDNSAFYFFLLSMLSFYLIPCTLRLTKQRALESSTWGPSSYWCNQSMEDIGG